MFSPFTHCAVGSSFFFLERPFLFLPDGLSSLFLDGLTFFSLGEASLFFLDGLYFSRLKGSLSVSLDCLSFLSSEVRPSFLFGLSFFFLDTLIGSNSIFMSLSSLERCVQRETPTINAFSA